mmetsp:Transcript_11715/g.20859  ORF Transcript_11715/g.20859 Transcript_11715/m.20859 type:complete len:226 (+) Transcript_11715:128-805(+)
MGLKPSRPAVVPSAAVEGLAAQLGVGMDALDGYFRRAVDAAGTAGDGKEPRMSLEVFRRAVATAAPFFEMGDMISQRLFQVLGGDSDGLSLEQFACGVYLFTCATSEEKLRLLFNMFDLNSSGSIKKKELRVMSMAIVKGSNHDVPESFESDFKALERIMTDASMQLYDTNRDGRLSFEEWKVYALDDRAVRRCFEALSSPASAALIERIRQENEEPLYKEKSGL